MKKRVWFLRLLSRHLGRQWEKGLLTVLLAALSLIGLTYLQASIQRGQEKIQWLYETVQVEGKILNRDTSYGVGGGFLSGAVGDQLEALGYFSNVEKIIGGAVDVAYTPGGRPLPKGKKQLQQPEEPPVYIACRPLRAYWSAADCLQLLDGSLSVAFFQEGETIENFLEHGEGVLLSVELLTALGAKTGDNVTVVWPGFALDIPISGIFPRTEGLECEVLFPAPYLTKLFAEYEQNWTYCKYRFQIDRTRNRGLRDFCIRAEEILTQAEQVQLLMDDSELTQAIEPLERNLTLLRILYPVMQVLSILLAAGLAALLVLQSAKDVAILRVLGVRRSGAALLLTVEQLLLAIFGLFIGVVLLQLIPALRTPWLFNAGLYLLGSLTGALAASLLRVRKNPLELLQVKE